MKINISHFRFWLELIALPFFIFLVIHLAGHGAMVITNPHHSHDHHSEEIHKGEYHEEQGHQSYDGDHFFSQEVLFGILFLCIFVWIWHRPFLKKWIPCQHEHCHSKHNWWHIAAIIAFCLHFFPEAEIRHQLLADFSVESLLSIASAIGFVSHFFVDSIVAITLSFAFTNTMYRLLSLGIIFILYAFSFVFEGELFHFLPTFGEGIILVLSAFLLAMFVHMPHKPKQCNSCEH